MIDVDARVLSRDTLAEGMVRILLYAPEIAAQATPGQFVHLLVPDGAHVLRRPISLMAFDTQAGTLTLAIQKKGQGTRILCAAQAGNTLRTLGPLGHGFDAKGARCVYFVGGGAGVAPILCAMDAFATTQSRAFFGFKSASCAYGLTQSPCPVIAVSEDGTLGEKALVTAPLLTAILARRPDRIMACGPRPMLLAVQRMAMERGIPCQISLEERMGCGIGACLGCSVKCKGAGEGINYKRVCADGPVFEAEEVCLDD